MMTLTIQITDEENIDDMKAVGAKDLKEFFLKKIGINASRVIVNHLTDENRGRMLVGEEYTHYEDIAE